jgi:hypothetical protein
MYTSSCIEQPRKKEDVSRRKALNFVLSLSPKTPLAHYPEFIVCLATNLSKK